MTKASAKTYTYDCHWCGEEKTTDRKPPAMLGCDAPACIAKHNAAVRAAGGMADRVDATVEQMQVSTPDQALDLLGREASCEELPTADDSVLAGGELGRRVGFGSHMNPNPPQLADAPS